VLHPHILKKVCKILGWLNNGLRHMNCGRDRSHGNVCTLQVWEVVCISQVTNVVEVRFIDMFHTLNLWSKGTYFRNRQPRHNCLLDEGCKVGHPLSNHCFAEGLS